MNHGLLQTRRGGKHLLPIRQRGVVRHSASRNGSVGHVNRRCVRGTPVVPFATNPRPEASPSAATAGGEGTWNQPAGCTTKRPRHKREGITPIGIPRTLPRTLLAAPSSLVRAHFTSTFPVALRSIGLAMCDSGQAAKTPPRGRGLARWIPGVERVFWPTFSLRRLSQNSNRPEGPKISGFKALSSC